MADFFVLFLIVLVKYGYNTYKHLILMNMNNNNFIYADIKIDGNDWFVITPEGNEFVFKSEDYDETHEDVEIVDPTSNKTYVVKFNE